MNPVYRSSETTRISDLPRAANQGIASSQSEAVLVLNPDCRVDGDAIALMIGAFGYGGKVGMTGPLLLNPDGEQAGGRRVYPHARKGICPSLGTAEAQTIFARPFFRFCVARRAVAEEPDRGRISGACMLVSRDALQQMGRSTNGISCIVKISTGACACAKRAIRYCLFRRRRFFTTRA